MALVLLVDDAADIRLLERAVLHRHGFDVREVASGAEALAVLASEELPDVVVLDVQMPEMDGWATLRAIRQSAHAAEIPVILCTVKAMAADVDQAWRAGCDGYLVKPFTIKRFVEEVEDVITRDGEQREKFRRMRSEDASSGN